jgi:hypothetical protein
MTNPKVDIRKLDQLLREGKTVKECAKYFKVTSGAISQRKAQLKHQIVRVASLEKAGEVVEAHLDMASELRKINSAINKELARAQTQVEDSETGDIRAIQEIIIKLSAEIRRQLETQIKIFEAYSEFKDRAAFQNEVLSILDQMQPGVRDEAIRRIKNAGALRGAITVD